MKTRNSYFFPNSARPDKSDWLISAKQAMIQPLLGHDDEAFAQVLEDLKKPEITLTGGLVSAAFEALSREQLKGKAVGISTSASVHDMIEWYEWNEARIKEEIRLERNNK